MIFTPSETLPEVMIIDTDVYEDKRGYFFETYQREKYLQHDISSNFVQDNVSFSKQGVLRGLHYQLERGQGKIVVALQGEIFDVAADIRKGSPTFGKWVGVTLSSENNRQVYVPEGFAHGFCILSETAHVLYKCTDYYSPTDERGLCWNDETLNIDWPVDTPIVSDRDNAFPTLKAIGEENLPEYR